jgi:hypothetical protein
MKPYDFIRNGVSYTFAPLPTMTEPEVYALIPEAKPIPAPGAGLKVEIVSKDLGTMNVNYTNASSVSATFKVRVGSVDRPDRVVPPGKTVTSTYTTTVKTGFTGQKLVVIHVESNTIILEQVL